MKSTPSGNAASSIRLKNTPLRAAICALTILLWSPMAFGQSAQRIVSIGSDVTETLCALGLAPQIVAIDTTSLHPADLLSNNASVGYMRALSPEGVVSAGATLIMATDKAGPPDVVKTLKTSMPYIEITDHGAPDAVPDKIRAIAKAVGREVEGDALARRVDGELHALADMRARIKAPMRALFVLNMQGGRLTVAGTATTADAMMKLSGLSNAASDLKGYKPIGEEALLSMAPDLVLVMTTGAASSRHDTGALSSNAALAATPAGRAKRIRNVDGGTLLSFGPRVAQLARDLMLASYPDL